MLYQTLLEGAVEDILLVCHENIHAVMFKFANGTSPHIDHPLVEVGHMFFFHAPAYLVLLPVVEKSQK